MKIKIIDLLNKIANDEEVPKKIKWQGQIYEYSSVERFYYQNSWSMYRDFYTEGNCLNDEVEILNEAKEDKIQKIYHCETSLTQNEVEIFITENLNQMVDKINELIDAVNELKRDK